MNKLLREIHDCKICKKDLPCTPNPIVQFQKKSKILLIGQAPGVLAHESNIPWNDKSGERLRSWLGMSSDQFYDPSLVALVPMGFCYPGRGKSGDLPPRKECAETWMGPVRDYLTKVELEIYIGKYACDREFGKYKNLTTLIQDQAKISDNRIVLPHPSPRNNIWLAKNEWFERDVLPQLREKVQFFLKI